MSESRRGGSEAPSSGMALLALILLLAQNLALGKQYPWALLPFDLGRWVWVAASLGLAVLLAEQGGFVTLGGRWPALRERLLQAAGHRAFLIALMAGNALFAVVNYHHFRGFGYAFPWTHVVVLAGTIAFVRRDRFWLSCAVSLGLLVASIIHFPLAFERSDMLPGVQRWWEYLAAGKSPYTYFQFSPDVPEVSVGYLPGTPLAHAPAWVLGLDLRWNQALWRLLWMIGAGVALTRHKADSPWRTVAHVFALNPYYNFRHDLYYEAFFTGIAAYHAWPRWRWLSLSVLVWTRQWAWVMAPFLALDWLLVREQARRTGQPPRAPVWPKVVRQAGWLALGMLAVSGGAVLVLYASTSWSLFVRSIFYFQGLAKFDYGFSLGPIAGMLGMPWILLPLQAVAAAALGLLALGRWWTGRYESGTRSGGGATEGIERLGLVALCVFVLLNPYSEVYLWLEPSFWILAAYTMRGQRAP